MFSSNEVAKMLANSANLLIQQNSVISHHIFILLIALLWSPPTLEKISIFNSLHELVANVVCLLFGTVHVLYSCFIRKTLLAVVALRNKTQQHFT